MEVNHIDDHVSHAVIGAKRVRELEIDQSAAMFNLLSSNLYSDGPLAAIREVLCNAWDIHVLMNITDKPLTVTLSGNEVTIRDYGCGLHDDQMVPIYGTFGGTTKVHDGKQNGGFGLGSKAPFAVADHFQVTSWHAGVKTVYVISKSSAEVGGKPGINPVVSVPTTESGLEVKFKFQGSASHYEKLIRQISRYGDMLVEFNGAIIPTLPFNKLERDYMLVSTNDLISSINLRYGTVVYPVPLNDAYRDEYLTAKVKTERIVPKTTRGWGNYSTPRLIVQAEPHSISVTPSRESLLLTEHTTTTIKALLIKFIEDTKSIEPEVLKYIPKSVDQMWGNISHMKSLTTCSVNSVYVGDRDIFKNETDAVFNLDQMIKSYLIAGYPDFDGFSKKHFEAKIKSLNQESTPMRGLIQTYLRIYRKRKAKMKLRGGWRASETNWVQRYVIAPIVLKMKTTKEILPSRLFCYEPRNYRKWQDATKYPRIPHEEQTPFLRNFIVLAYNRTDMEYRLEDFPCMKHYYGAVDKCLVYITPRSQTKTEAARVFFESMGYYVVDLTKRHSWEAEDLVVEVVKEKKKPEDIKKRLKGLNLMSAALTTDNMLNMNLMRGAGKPRIEAPEVVAQIGTYWRSPTFDGLSDDTIHIIAKLYGDKIGITGSIDQYTRWSKGRPTMRKYIYNKLVDILTTDQVFRNSISVLNTDNIVSTDEADINQVMLMLTGSPELVKHYKLPDPLTPEHKLVHDLYTGVTNHYARWFTSDEKKALEKLFLSIPIPPHVKKLMGTIGSSVVLGAFNIYSLDSILNGTKATKEQKAQTIKIIIEALKG